MLRVQLSTDMASNIDTSYHPLLPTQGPTMSTDDHANFPPGTHMLEDRMFLMHSPIQTGSDCDTENANGHGKKELILKPTPSDDPEDPLVGQTLLRPPPFGSYHGLNKNLELVHSEKNGELWTYLFIRRVHLCPA